MNSKRLSSIKMFGSSTNSDLLSHVSSFLPYIEAANKALADNDTTSNHHVDEHLWLDDEKRDGSDADSSNAEERMTARKAF